MFFYEGYICPVCKSKFTVTDDIVACPECGAPHHRECWKQEGRCHFEADHGTPQQWKRPEESTYEAPVLPTSQQQEDDSVKFCTNCGHKNPKYAEFCSRCGQHLISDDWSSQNGSAQHNPPPGYSPFNQSPFGSGTYPGSYGEYMPFHIPSFDPYGGAPHDDKIQDICAEEFVYYIGNNSAYYIPRFFKMSHTDSRASWNWAAFLFTPYWLLYRKNYVAGSIVLLLSVLQSFINVFIFANYIDTSTYDSINQSVNALIEKGNYTICLVLILLYAASLLIKIIFGLIGNNLYMRTSVSRIQKIRKKYEGNIAYLKDVSYHQELTTAGGVSLILVAVACSIVWLGEVFINTLFLPL